MSALPAELWARIFSLCDAHDLLGATRISKLVGVEAERALFDTLLLEHIMRVLLLLRGLKIAHPDRRERRLRAVRRVFLQLASGRQIMSRSKPQRWEHVEFPNRTAILRAVTTFILSLPALAHLELLIINRDDSMQFDPSVLLKAQFRLTSLSLDIPYTSTLAEFIASQSGSLTHLTLLNPVWSHSPSEWVHFDGGPQLPRLVTLRTVTALVRHWPRVKELRLHADDDILHASLTVWLRGIPNMHLLAPLAHSLRILYVTANAYPGVVRQIAQTVPRLHRLIIDVISLPSMLHGTPWDDPAWAAAFEGMRMLVNFRLRLPALKPSRRTSHPWDARKPQALTMWHAVCPTLRYVAFPGDEKHWVWNSQRRLWTNASIAL